MDASSDTITVEVSDARSFVRQLLRDAGLEAQLADVDERNATEPVFVAAQQFLEMSGARAESAPGEETAGEEAPTRAYAIFRGKYHVNVRKAAWKSLLALIPLIVQLIKAQADPTQYLQAAGSVLGGITSLGGAVQKLSPDEAAVCLALRAAGGERAQAPAVAAGLGGPAAGWDETRVAELLKSLASRSVLSETAEGYQVV